MKPSYQKGKREPVGVPVAKPTIVPRFDVDDEAAYKYLDENGYVVIKDVCTEDEIKTARGKAWDYIEGLGEGLIKRDDVKSWGSSRWPDPYGKGIVAGDGVGQSEFLWYCRGIPKVKKIFQTIWNEEEVVTSFDGFCIHRPFEYNPKWKTKVGSWYHLDQNGIHKPNKLCIQGFLNLYDSDLEDGGLVVVPQSPKIFKKIFLARPHLRQRGDFIMLAHDRQLWENEAKKANLGAIKVCAKAGDFVLWDSRTIHCNSPALSERPIPTDGSILPPRRLVAYICMTPKKRLTPSIQSARIQAYKQGNTTSHWPEECTTASVRKNRKRGYVPPQLTAEQKTLIPIK
eukprot:TRINITY_DN11658_c0_g1_i1.p1 TRINITY_DN11658_c0_g1~~TRINITY_DN11658_c0_g1_i1.p1  ORF type:complete len:342 (+),score=40.34 TRINITY_DN11658_c0_g1_i1:31-1056(+)